MPVSVGGLFCIPNHASPVYSTRCSAAIVAIPRDERQRGKLSVISPSRRACFQAARAWGRPITLLSGRKSKLGMVLRDPSFSQFSKNLSFLDELVNLNFSCNSGHVIVDGVPFPAT